MLNQEFHAVRCSAGCTINCAVARVSGMKIFPIFSSKQCTEVEFVVVCLVVALPGKRIDEEF
jgi:hypothetical protein